MAARERRTARHAGSAASTRGRRGGGRLSELDVYDDDHLDPEDSHGGEGQAGQAETTAAQQKADEEAAKKADAKRKREAEAEAKRQAEKQAAAARAAASGGGAATSAHTRPPAAPASLQKLTILPWNTTDELWSIYDRIAIDLDESGHSTAVAPLIRAVLEANLPDFSTKRGKEQAIEYATAWKKHRGQGVKEHHASNIRIKRSTQIALKDVQRELRKEGIRLDIGAVVSGILNSHIPSLDQAIALLRN